MPFKNRHSNLFMVCFVALCLFVFAAGNAEAKKPEPTDPPPPEETEAGTLVLRGFNIATVHWDGSLRIWSDNGESPGSDPVVPDSSWMITGVPPSAVAIGDLDGNDLKEVIIRRECSYEGDPVTFINVYEGEDRDLEPDQARNYIDSLHPWWTTYGSPVDYVKQGVSIRDQIIAANLDDDPGDEIILITASTVSIFDYVANENNIWAQGSGTLKKIGEISFSDYFPDAVSGWPAAATVGNVGGAPTPDIVITVDIRKVEYGTLFGNLLIWTDPLVGDNVSTVESELVTYGYNPDALQLSNMEMEGDAYTTIWAVYSNQKADTCTRGKTVYPCNSTYDSFLSFWKKDQNGMWTETRSIPFLLDSPTNPGFFKIATGEIPAISREDVIVVQSGAQAGIDMNFDIYNTSNLDNYIKRYSPGKLITVAKVTIHDGKMVLGGMMQGDMTPFLQVVDPSDMSVDWELLGGLDYKTSNVSAEVDDFAVTGSLP